MQVKKGKVLILNAQPLEELGGVERFLSYLVTILKDRGYEVKVFHRQNSMPRWAKKIPAQAPLIGLFVGLAANREIRRDSSVVAVISNGWVGWFPIIGKVRKIHSYNGVAICQAEAIRPFISFLSYLKSKYFYGHTLERLSGKGKFCISNSEQTKNEVRRLYKHDSTVIWRPINLEHFQPLDSVDCRLKLGLPINEKVGLFVGSTQPVKGFNTVVELCRVIREVFWLIVVRGERPVNLENRRNVKIIQNAPYELLPIIYSSADFAIFPSRYESFGQEESSF